MGVNLRGDVVVRKKFSRQQLLHFTANLRVELIGMEACGGAHRDYFRFAVTRAESRRTRHTTTMPMAEHHQHSEFGDLVRQRLDDVQIARS